MSSLNLLYNKNDVDIFNINQLIGNIKVTNYRNLERLEASIVQDTIADCLYICIIKMFNISFTFTKMQQIIVFSMLISS